MIHVPYNFTDDERLRIINELNIIDEETRKWHASRSSKAVHIYSRTKVIREILKHQEAAAKEPILEKVKKLFSH
jgi:hypothetical protein